MYSKLKRLRTGGERKPDRDISADPGMVGHMTVATVAGEIVATAYAVGSSGRQDPIIPMLYRAKLTSMQNDRMLLQGYERSGGDRSEDTDRNRQEWSVQVMSEQPRAPAPSERMG